MKKQWTKEDYKRLLDYLMKGEKKCSKQTN